MAEKEENGTAPNLRPHPATAAMRGPDTRPPRGVEAAHSTGVGGKATGPMTDPYYRTREWRQLRQAALLRDLYRCAVRGCPNTATIVDHIVSRRSGGPNALPNLRCLCSDHDNQVKENGYGIRRSKGVHRVIGCDAQGRPLDPMHWWHIPRKE
jgi:5-methylcytosine-specific restriction enzyme A